MDRRTFDRALRAVALATPLLSGGVAADAPAERALGRLQAWLDGTKTLEARFEQSLVSGALGGGVVERGRLYVERPGRLRFDYAEPERKVAIVIDSRTWLYLAADRQLVLGRLDPTNDLLPTLLAGTKPLDELFEAALDGNPAAPEDGSEVRLLLRPKGAPGSDLERVILTLRPPAYAIETAEVLDGAGNRMDYVFSGMHRNERIPRGAFEFDPPRGTEIQGSHDAEPGTDS